MRVSGLVSSLFSHFFRPPFYQVQMAFGPTIICPEQLVVHFPSPDSQKKQKKKKKGLHHVKCDILVNPVPPLENITWVIGNHMGRKYWATRSSVRSFARTAHSFACSGLFALLVSSAALTHSLTRSVHSLARRKENDCMAVLSVFFLFSTTGRRTHLPSLQHPSKFQPVL